MQNIAVLGIGNILLKDDGVGVEVANRLAEMPWPDNVSIIDAGTAIMSLLDVFIKNEKIIVVDCLKGGHEPGTIYRLNPEQLGAWQKESLSLHDVQVLDMMKMAALFNSHPDVVIFGIEPHTLELNLGLSETMQERFHVLVEHVRQELVNTIENTICKEKCEKEGTPHA
jgi:hydrogenase maturation protease